ncbi:MAG TPA: hypothetical protein DEW46_17720, partial [Verrucomicrobia bacterium]|nr:hypothetical protein [Verrucomicrobiota bacterium]
EVAEVAEIAEGNWEGGLGTSTSTSRRTGDSRYRPVGQVENETAPFAAAFSDTVWLLTGA